MGISKFDRILGFQLIKLANTLNMLNDGIQVLPLVVTVALRSANTSSISGSSLLPLAEGTVICSFVDANGSSHHQVRHPITVNRIRTKKYTKTHLCKHCGDGDLRKLTRFVCHLCNLSFAALMLFVRGIGFWIMCKVFIVQGRWLHW